MSSSPVTFQSITLANGLTVIGEFNPLARSMAAGYFVKTGARDETARISGVSHFLEHMMFKGSERRSAEDINREFDELGARYNAFTSEELTVYYGAVLPQQQFRLIDLLSDMMRPALRQSDFDLEKNVILEEIAMYEDQPSFRVFDLASPRFYNGYPLGNSILGSVQSITELERNAMLAYFEARYAPNNLLLAVTGNYDWDALLEQLTQDTSSWQPAVTGRAYPPFTPLAGNETVSDPKLNRVHYALYAPGVSMQSHLRHAASLLASCLGDSSGSRLYWALVDRGLADSAGLSLSANDKAGAFAGYLSSSPERAAQVLETAIEVLQGVHDDLPSESEWQAARNKLAAGLTLQAETPFGRLMPLGRRYTYLQSYASVDETVDAILGTELGAAEELLSSRPFEQLFTMRLGPAAGPAAEGQ
jgi:predicted Zn-dependent peptidase